MLKLSKDNGLLAIWNGLDSVYNLYKLLLVVVSSNYGYG